MEKYIDTHAHYGHGRFKQNTNDLLEEMWNCCRNIIQVGTNNKTNAQTIQLINKHNSLYGIIGYFPTDVWEIEASLCNNGTQNLEKFLQQLQDKKIVAVGEIGLDYNWDKVGNCCFGEDARKIQQKWFVEQINIAKKHQLPICVHSRDAEQDTLDIFNQYDHLDGVIHCFSYGVNTAKKAIDKGLYLGIGGTSTYPANTELRNVIKIAPLDRLLLETDAPYLSPLPVRREINTSKNIEYVIQNIASIKGVDVDEVIDVTNKNAYSLFRRLQ